MNHSSKLVSALILALASPIFYMSMIASITMYIKIYVYNVEELLSRDMLSCSIAAEQIIFDAL